MAKKKILVSVTNDISNDQRVHKQCNTLIDMGYNVQVIGRWRKDSIVISRKYSVKRFRLFFNKGSLFYAEYNLRLFFYVLFKPCDVLLSNDLDTLLANYLASKLKNVPLVYDSHEYYTEVPELEGRPFVKSVWLNIEKLCLPAVKHMYTVNESIANLYRQKYNREVGIIRNIPPAVQLFDLDIKQEKEKLGLPVDKKLLIVQGTGINVDRGVEEVVQAMQYVDNTTLMIIGSGDVLQILKQMVKDLELEDKVKFIAKVSFDKLVTYTSVCDVGLTVDKDTNLNYRYSLPNKLFNYMQAGIAILASNLVEVAKIVNKYNIGVLIDNHNPKHIAKKINELFSDVENLNLLKENSKNAAKELTWEKESETLKKIFSEFQ